ncbi:MAG: hypothetical protein ABSA74_02750 [Candidatus Staskawiczbacteria bacterium]|jgi:hypothetical protein
MNSKKIFSLTLLGFLALPLVISATDIVAGGGLHSIGTGPAVDIVSLMHGIERGVAFVFGAIAVICFVVAGVLFLTAQGAPEKLKTAKAAVIWGVAGVIVGIAAYSIVAIVEAIIT